MSKSPIGNITQILNNVHNNAKFEENEGKVNRKNIGRGNLLKIKELRYIDFEE